MPDTKFKSGIFSSFRDMTSGNLPLNKEQVIKFKYLAPEIGLTWSLSAPPPPGLIGLKETAYVIMSQIRVCSKEGRNELQRIQENLRDFLAYV